MSPVIGVLVGGKGRRMGGVAKGNLELQGRTLLARTLELCVAAAPSSSVFVVGDSEAYTVDDNLRLEDAPGGIGPLGGLRALLLEAELRGGEAIALAVDMPYLQLDLLKRLQQVELRGACAPRQEGRWQPLFARYRSKLALPAVERCLEQSHSSLQAVFRQLGSDATELELSESERSALDDWDSPLDLLQKR